MGTGLVSLIVGLLTNNTAATWSGTTGALVGANSLRSYLRSRNESRDFVNSDLTVIANHPAVQREATKLGLSQEQLVSIIGKAAFSETLWQIA